MRSGVDDVVGGNCSYLSYVNVVVNAVMCCCSIRVNDIICCNGCSIVANILVMVCDGIGDFL
jgi:hypothetical protein